MPKVNRYKNKDGLYIRAAQGGQISTYQVTKGGEEDLRRAGYGRGGEISPAKLKELRDQGLIYTRGNGPGALESIVPSQAAPRTPYRDTSPPAQAAPRTPHRGTSPSWQADPTSWQRPQERPFWESPVDSGPAYPPTRPVTPSRTRVPVPAASWPSDVSSVPALEALASRSRDDEGTAILVVVLGGIGLLAIVAFFFLQLLLWVLLLFLPFGLMAGFLANTKGRPISEGYFWGQFVGPVGLIIVTLLPASDPMSARALPESDRIPAGTRASSDTGAVIVWSVVGFGLIVILFVLVIVVSRNGS